MNKYHIAQHAVAIELLQLIQAVLASSDVYEHTLDAIDLVANLTELTDHPDKPE